MADKNIYTVFDDFVSQEELNSLNINFCSREEYIENTSDYFVHVHLYNLKKLRKDYSSFNFYLLRSLKSNAFIAQIS